jgi:hypothetical protein
MLMLDDDLVLPSKIVNRGVHFAFPRQPDKLLTCFSIDIEHKNKRKGGKLAREDDSRKCRRMIRCNVECRRDTSSLSQYGAHGAAGSLALARASRRIDRPSSTMMMFSFLSSCQNKQSLSS